jgi:peroxiredoxin
MKFKSLQIIIYLFLFVTPLFSQVYINGRIEGYINREVILCTQFGDKSKIVASIKTNQNSAFSFKLEEYDKGLYRVYLDNDEYFDLIVTNQNIDFSTKPENPMYNMRIFSSEENVQLYNFYVENFILDYKIKILNQLLEIYPEGNFQKQIQKELKKEIENKNKNLQNAIKKNKNSFAGRYLTYFYEPIPNKKINEAEKLEFLKKNYLSFFNFNDPEMINSDAYTRIIFNYFKIYRSNKHENMLKASKNILNHISDKDPKIFTFIFEYILEGLESIGLSEQVAQLSIEFGNRCSEIDDNLNLRIQNSINLSVGKKAPDFTAKTITGQEIILSEIKNDNILLIFWASWCEHCKQLIPKLLTAENLFNQADVYVITVSLDSDRESLNHYISQSGMNWPVICDYKSWDNEIVKQYSIYATPMMFVIDKDLTIKSKPYNEDALFSYIGTLLNK